MQSVTGFFHRPKTLEVPEVLENVGPGLLFILETHHGAHVAAGHMNHLCLDVGIDFVGGNAAFRDIFGFVLLPFTGDTPAVKVIYFGVGSIMDFKIRQTAALGTQYLNDPATL